MVLVSMPSARGWPPVLFVVALIALTGFDAPETGGAETLPGPVRAEVVSVIDGDTLLVRARIWLDVEVEVHVRVAGIDAPERHGKCTEERALAERARDLVATTVDGAEVMLSELQHDKYAGRVLARVAIPDGRDLGELLLAAGVARAYDGGPRQDWCREAAEVREN